MCDIAPLQGHDDKLHQKKEEVQLQEQGEEKPEDKCKLLASKPLEIKLPSLGKLQVKEDNDGGGVKTPTSLDHKIPAILKCPPAPRKPKSLSSTKRKSTCRRALLDLSNEIESLFPPGLVADLGNKIKKVRHMTLN